MTTNEAIAKLAYGVALLAGWKSDRSKERVRLDALEIYEEAYNGRIGQPVEEHRMIALKRFDSYDSRRMDVRGIPNMYRVLDHDTGLVQLYPPPNCGFRLYIVPEDP